MMQHAIGNIAMRPINGDIIHISYVMLNADYFVSQVFLEKPLVIRKILA